jgi:SpoVK/Ycf46/Vps4 family AAA+-type ATPase
VLLHGPSGCGKTMLAQAIVEAAGMRMMLIQVRMFGMCNYNVDRFFPGCSARGW